MDRGDPNAQYSIFLRAWPDSRAHARPTAARDLVREVERKNKELNDYIETLETKVTLQRASAFKLIRVGEPF